MKKSIVFAMVLSVFSVSCFASNPFDNFKANVTGSQAQANLDNLAKDLGPALGGAAFRSGKTLGFPGFDLSLRVPYTTVSSDDAIVKASGISNIPFPLIQAEIGLPLGIDLIGRYTSYYSATMTGFGLRFCALKSWIPGVPDVSVQTVYNMLSVSSSANIFKANTLSTAASASWKVLIFEPFIGISLDNTTVTPDSTVSNLSGSASTVRYDGGVNLTIFPMTYLMLGVSSSGGNTGYSAGLGVVF